MKNLFLIIIISLFFSCKSEQKKSIENSEKLKSFQIKTDTVIEDNTMLFDMHLKTKQSFNRKGIEVYAEQLYSDNQNTFAFVPLFYREQYTYKTTDSILRANRKLLFEQNEEGRYKIGDSVADKYFKTEKLNKLLLINDNQQIIDTLIQEHYGYYHDALNDYYTSVYKLPKNFNTESSYNVISSDLLLKEDLRTSPNLISNDPFTKELIKRNQFSYDNIYSNYHFLNKKDTISLIAISDYKNQKEAQYLLKNGFIKDSIINDYFIESMTPIPLATDTEYTYIAYFVVYESDISWTGLLSIDIEDYKFIFHERNKMER